MHGLPASDPAPFLGSQRTSVFGHFIWPMYTQSSNKHDSTNPSSDPSPCGLSLSVFHSVTSQRFSFGSSSLWQGFVLYISCSPSPCLGLSFFSYSKHLLNAVRFRKDCSLHSQRSTDGLHTDLLRCGFHSSIFHSFHVSMSSCVLLKSGTLKISFCFQRRHTVFLPS